MEYAMHHPFIGRGPRDFFAYSEASEDRRGERRGGPRGDQRRGGERRGGEHRRGHGHGRGPGFDGPMGPGFGPMGPGFGGPRPGGRRRRGDVRLAALLLIAESPRNGYQIIQEIETRSEGSWKPSPGAIYPALSQLEDEGLIQPSSAVSGKAFEITEAGTAEAEAAKDRPAPWENQGEDQDTVRKLMLSARQAGQAAAAIAQSGNPDLVNKAIAELDDLKRRLYQLLAEN